MEYSICATSGIPIYQQLTEQIRAAIARAKLRTDDRLPSVRELSQSLVVNPNTVAKAYTELEREGYVYTRPGMGVFVGATRAPLPAAVRRERLIAQLDRVLVDAVGTGCTADELLELVSQRVSEFKWPAASAAVVN